MRTGSVAEGSGLEGTKRKIYRDVSNLVGPAEARNRDNDGAAACGGGLAAEVVIARIDTRGIRAVRITADAQGAASGRIRVSSAYRTAYGTVGSWLVPRIAAPGDEGVSFVVEWPGEMLVLEAVSIGGVACTITASWQMFPFDLREDPSK